MLSGTSLVTDSFDQALLVNSTNIEAFRIQRLASDSNTSPTSYTMADGLWTTSGTYNQKNIIDLTSVTGPNSVKGIHVASGDGLIVSYSFGNSPVLNSPDEICGFIECTLVDPHLQLGPHNESN